MAPPAALLTPLPTPPPLHRRSPYTPSPALLSSALTWSGRAQQWDLPYFPLWDASPAYACPNYCLWGSGDTVDNYLLCQDDKRCACQPAKLSTAVVWASKCLARRCAGEGGGEGEETAPADAVGYVQTLLVEFCRNAWREEGGAVTGFVFVVPTGGAWVDGVTVAQTGPGPVTSTPTTATGTPNPTSTPHSDSDSSTSTTSPTNTSPTNTTPLKIGLGIGIPLLTLLLAAILLLLYRRRHPAAGPPQEVEGDIPWTNNSDRRKPPQQSHPVEMSGRRTPVVVGGLVEAKIEEERERGWRGEGEGGREGEAWSPVSPDDYGERGTGRGTGRGEVYGKVI